MDNLKNVLAKDLMQSKLITLHPKDKLERVKDIFNEFNIRHIPIVVSGCVKGIISKSDFLHIEGSKKNSFDQFLNDKMFRLHTVDEYMNSEVVCCKMDTPVVNLLNLFLTNEIHSVLVAEDEVLMGIITPQDILKWMKTVLESEF